MTMEATTDPVAYQNAWLDLPFGSPRARTKNEAHQTPGCHLKSNEKAGRWPRFFGRLVSFSPEMCIVVSKAPAHGIDGKPTVWTGTSAEYARMWEVD